MTSRRRQSRTTLLAAVGALAALAASFGCRAPRAEAKPPRPNVLLIVVDALRADRLGCYGYARETSPNLDALAAEGVLFQDVMAPADETSLSIPSLFTSLRPHEHGVWWDTEREQVRVSPGLRARSFAEILHDQGYVTGAISANQLVGSLLGVDKGFDSFQESRGAQTTGAAAVTARATRWLENYDRRQGPFLLFLHYLDPHYSYEPPSEFCRFGRPGYTPRDDRLNAQVVQLFRPYEDRAKPTPPAALAQHGLSRRDIARLSDLYDAEVCYADSQIGRLLQRLEQLHLSESTIVVVTADHGESFLEHGHLVHRGSLYQEAVHVPLIVRAPGVRGGRTVEEVVETIDIAPTLLELTQTKAGPPHTGRSVYRALVRGEKIPPRVAVAELAQGRGRALRLGRWKLIETPERVELYDLQQDPGETRNLATSNPQQIARLRAAAQESTAKPAAAATTNARSASSEELRALRSLGYIK